MNRLEMSLVQCQDTFTVDQPIGNGGLRLLRE